MFAAGIVSFAGIPSLSPLTWAGKLKTTQWDQVPPGASGSSQIKASAAPIPEHPTIPRAVSWSDPSQVNALGIMPSSVTAEL